MIRIKCTIAVLLICFIALCVICFQARPLLTETYDRGPLKFLNTISKVKLGQKLIKHYSGRLDWMVYQKIGRYKDINRSEPEKAGCILAGFVFVGLTALFVSLVSLVLFIINATNKREPPVSKRTLVLILLLTALNGTIIRLAMASASYGNYDIQSYEIVADIVTRGGNVYANTNRYVYSPVWFTVLGIFKRIQLQLPALSFHFIVKSFLCGIDLLTLVFLLLIAKGENISMIKTAIFFYLNPVSFLITGYHGQFENLAVFMVVVGLFAYFKLKNKPALGKTLLWLFATMGMIVKHNIFYELIICLNSAIRRYRVKLLLFVISVLVFLALLIPYWSAGSKGIIRNVFLYSSGFIGQYGIISLFHFPPLKYVFIVGLFVFPLFLRSKDIVRQCLLGMIFFLTFTTGIGIQYFMLPIAFGALRPSRGFLLYTLAGSLFILGSGYNVFMPILYFFRWNIVWVAVLFWFIAEMAYQKAPAVITAKTEQNKKKKKKKRFQP